MFPRIDRRLVFVPWVSRGHGGRIIFLGIHGENGYEVLRDPVAQSVGPMQGNWMCSVS